MSPATLSDIERVLLAHSCAAPVVKCNTKRVEIIACVLAARFNVLAWPNLCLQMTSEIYVKIGFIAT